MQQFTDSPQHPSLQQVLLHSPVLQPSLQQPSAQQVSLQHVFTLSMSSAITYSIIKITPKINIILGAGNQTECKNYK